MRKTFDEYIQARIMKVYLENKEGSKTGLCSGACKSFDEYAKWYSGDETHDTAGWLMAFGCGRQRAEDYARYIEEYLKRNVVSKRPFIRRNDDV